MSDRLIAFVVRHMSGLVTDAALHHSIIELIGRRVRRLDPADALRFTLRLDQDLYSLQGRLAVAYEGGIHPKHRHMRYHDFFVHRIGPGERVLDVGCGNGALAYDIADKAGARVLGVDLNAQHIAVAKERYHHPNVTYELRDVLKSSLDQSFDTVVLSNVLEHIDRRVEFLRELSDACHFPRFLVRVPLFEREWRVPVKKELGVDYRLDPTHCTEYTLESFASEMEAGGLRVVHQEVRWGEIWAEAVPDRPRERTSID